MINKRPFSINSANIPRCAFSWVDKQQKTTLNECLKAKLGISIHRITSPSASDLFFEEKNGLSWGKKHSKQSKSEWNAKGQLQIAFRLIWYDFDVDISNTNNYQKIPSTNKNTSDFNCKAMKYCVMTRTYVNKRLTITMKIFIYLSKYK